MSVQEPSLTSTPAAAFLCGDRWSSPLTGNYATHRTGYDSAVASVIVFGVDSVKDARSDQCGRKGFHCQPPARIRTYLQFWLNIAAEMWARGFGPALLFEMLKLLSGRSK
jgi:hypothetical protein